jgi:hypothetical protein
MKDIARMCWLLNIAPSKFEQRAAHRLSHHQREQLSPRVIKPQTVCSDYETSLRTSGTD